MRIKKNINDEFNFAYNIRSFSTWEKILKTYENYSIRFEPYKMDTNLKRVKDPIRKSFIQILMVRLFKETV